MGLARKLLCPGMVAPAEPRRVLLVEDEPTIAVTLRDELSEQGYEVVCVGDGRVAVELLREQAFATVITDLRLPGASGVEVAAAARQASAAARVLLITAFVAPGVVSAADAVLKKPFANASVLAWLAQRVA